MSGSGCERVHPRTRGDEPGEDYPRHLPAPAPRRLELGEVGLPDAVGARSGIDEERPACLAERSTLGLVPDGKKEALRCRAPFTDASLTV